MSNVHLLAMVYILDHKSSVIFNFPNIKIKAFALGGLNFFGQKFHRLEKLFLPYRKNVCRKYRKNMCAFEDTMMKPKQYYPEFQEEMCFL